MNAYLKGFNPEYHQESPTLDQIKAIPGYTIIEFGTPWCGHCQAAVPALREVLSELDLNHVKVFDGKGKPLGRQFKVKLWPTLILLRSGVEIARLVRPLRAQEVREFVAHAKGPESRG